MPSYHWRETAVILLYSIGCPFSLMRMPQEGAWLPLRVVLRAAGAAPVVGRAAPRCRAPPVGLDDCGTPEVQGLVQLPLGQDGCHGAAVGEPGLRGDARARRLSPHLQPRAAEFQTGPLLQAYLRLDGRPQLRTGQGPHWRCERRYAAWPCWPVGLGQVTASDPWGPVALRGPALAPGLTVGLQGRGILLGRAVLDPTGRSLGQVSPAGAEPGRVRAPRPRPPPVVLVSACVGGSTPQGGGLLGGRSDRGRQTLPERAASCRHGRPRVVGFPPAASSAGDDTPAACGGLAL